jgi:predicted nucleic acid-binding protein
MRTVVARKGDCSLIDTVMLDASAVGVACHPRPSKNFLNWYRQLAAVNIKVIIPEIADFEVRRELIRTKRTNSLFRLNRLKETLVFAPLNSQIMLRAAELWADARNRGRPTAGPERLDCDVILAAQALERGATIISENINHLTQFTSVVRWQDMTFPTV